MKKLKTEDLFELAKEKKIKDIETYFGDSKSYSVMVSDGKVENLSIEENSGLSVRGIYKNSMGYVYTENLNNLNPEELIAGIKENAEIMEASEKEEIHFNKDICKELNLKNPKLENVSEKEKQELVLEMEKKTFSVDDRIEAVDYCIYGESLARRAIKNSNGIDLFEEKNIAYAYVSTVAREGEDVKSASAYMVSNRFEDFDASSLAKEAAEKALEQLGAKSMASGEMKTLLSNEVSASLLQAFAPVFSGENVQRNLSLLKGKIGEIVGDEKLSIVDDPFMENKAGSRKFDDEGTCTLKKDVVKNGLLMTFLHNKKTGGKDGLSSTGNAYKASYKSPVSIAPTNFFIRPGLNSLEEAMDKMETGIYITDVQGLHAGLNSVSGDFSLSARGFIVSGGKKAEAVNQITIAGNYFDMLKEIEMICSDLKFIMPGSGHVGSPSVLIGKLDISGE